MTIGEYIKQKLQAFGITQAQLEDVLITYNIMTAQEYSSANQEEVGKVMCDIVEEMCLAPYQKSVSESGFSISWDVSKLGNYYLWLCKRWGKKPNQDIISQLGIPTIIDRTNMW